MGLRRRRREVGALKRSSATIKYPMKLQRVTRTSRSGGPCHAEADRQRPEPTTGAVMQSIAARFAGAIRNLPLRVQLTLVIALLLIATTDAETRRSYIGNPEPV